MAHVFRGAYWTFVSPGFGARGASPLVAVEDLSARILGETIEVVAARRIDTSDPHLSAHFPHLKIFPGVFVLESLRQTVGSILIDPEGRQADIMAVHSIRFVAPLMPGDRLRLVATLKERTPTTFDADAVVTRSDGLVAARLKTECGSIRADEAPIDARVIRSCLPHAHPMLLIDRIVTLEPGSLIVAIKAVSGAEPCYRDLPRDLPPERYAYPASLMLESFGQAAATLWIETAGGRNPDDLVILTAARNCRIDGYAYPGDTLRHVARIHNVVGDTALVEGEIWIGERRVATVQSMMASIRSPKAFLAQSAPPRRTEQDVLV
jgi:3-hydroxymyristoyl/3-hydroxydecanoyl-(acyl carrier protein) dehydratase